MLTAYLLSQAPVLSLATHLAVGLAIDYHIQYVLKNALQNKCITGISQCQVVSLKSQNPSTTCWLIYIAIKKKKVLIDYYIQKYYHLDYHFNWICQSAFKDWGPIWSLQWVWAGRKRRWCMQEASVCVVAAPREVLVNTHAMVSRIVRRVRHSKMKSQPLNYAKQVGPYRCNSFDQ